MVKEIEVGHLQGPPLTRSDLQKLALGTAPVGAALTACIHKWEQISTPTTILAIIREGYLLPFSKGKFPPVTQNPQEYKIGQEEQVAVELLKLLEEEAIEEVLPPYGPGFYNLLFVVPKQPEGWRPVLNVKALNEYVTKVNFKMETSSTVQVALADAKWAVTLDLKDAFFHIPMHPKARPFLRFMSQNRVWQFKVLPFGLTVAPFLFIWVMRPVVKELRRQGIRVHIYLDDMIIFHTDETTLRHHQDTALTLLQELGFHINWGKSQLVPVSTIVYLGMEFTLKSNLVRPPMDKCLEIKELAQKFMDNAYMTARQWSILLGKLAFLATMVPQGRLHQRELRFHLRQHWDFNWDLQTTVQIPMTESVQQTLVDTYSKPESRKAIKSTITLQDYLHRRKSRGLGGSHGIPHGIRSVEPRGGTNAHQCFRTQSSHQHHNRVQGDVNRSNSYDSHGQHHSAGLSPESRRYEELHSIPSNTTTVCSSLGTKIGDSESAYSGQEKLPCRPSVKARSVDSYRMDSPVISSTSVVGGLVLPGDRCICHHAQLSTSSVLLSHTRPTGSCCECTESGLERSFTVHVSSSTSHVSGVTETEELAMQRHPRVSAKPGSSVVSPSPGTISSEGKGSQKTSKKARYNIPATQRSSSSGAGPAELHRNVVSSQALKERGYSDKATTLILGDIGASTKVIYDSKWKRFAVWCSEQQPQVTPRLVTEVQLAEFFSELDTDESLSSHSAIAGYRSAINSVLKCYNRQEVVFSSSISRMLQTIKRNKPRIKKNRVPKWNLALVLRHLAKKPYEPMQTINRKHLTYKTAFLVLLGTACRRSELHALDADSFEHHPQWEWINLRVLPDFVAKHQVHCADANTPRSFRLNAMVSVDKEEKLLCPVRALRYYILRSDPIRKKRKRLFLPIDSSVPGDISANTISWWIHKLIQEAYDQASEEDIRLTGMEGTKPNLFRATHEIRALAGSIAWQHGTTSLKDIMSACYWQNHNVFTDHYLRDVSAVKEDQLIIASHILQAFGKM